MAPKTRWLHATRGLIMLALAQDVQPIPLIDVNKEKGGWQFACIRDRCAIVISFLMRGVK